MDKAERERQDALWTEVERALDRGLYYNRETVGFSRGGDLRKALEAFVDARIAAQATPHADRLKAMVAATGSTPTLAEESDPIGPQPVAWRIVNDEGVTVLWSDNEQAAIWDRDRYWPCYQIQPLYAAPPREADPLPMVPRFKPLGRE